MTLDPEDFSLRVRQAEAALKSVQINLASASTEFDRYKALVKEKSVPQMQYDLAEAKFEMTKAAYAQAEITVDTAKKAQRDSVIRAPYPGVVTRRLVSEGEFAASMPPTPLITIEELGLVDVRLQLPATEIGRVKKGDALLVRIPGTQDQVHANITRVVDSLDPRTRTFAVIAEVANADHKLRPGLFVEAQPAKASDRVPDRVSK